MEMTPEMTPERKIHQKKENKIPYLLLVSRIHELTKATQFIDLFGEMVVVVLMENLR
jgi:hypothetical protein